MKLENQVCSLMLAKKLKKLGVKQESLFWWTFFKNGKPCKPNLVYQLDKKYVDKSFVSAFTVAELGEMLPQDIWIDKKRYEVIFEMWSDGEWYVDYKYKEEYLIGSGQHEYEKSLTCLNRTEANARAKMLIYLLENKLINL